MHNVHVSKIRRISAQPRAVNAYSSAEDISWMGHQIGWIGEIWEALSLTILLTALLWVLISIPVAIAVGTVISFGQSGRPRFHPARRPVGRRPFQCRARITSIRNKQFNATPAASYSQLSAR
jgi:hypothetical protein